MTNKIDKIQMPDGQVLKLNGGSGLELCDIGMALYVDETKGLRRYLNGQIVDINTNTQAFLNRLKEITTLHPSLLCTEEEWQSAKTLSAFGQVGKFVFNYSGADIVSVRIPAIVNVQGLFDLQNLGLMVAESLPNHTHTNSITLNRVWGNGTNRDYGACWSGDDCLRDTQTITTTTSNASSSIYKDNAHVQQEAIQYPYFIQIATGSETENNIINEIELNNPYSLFDSKYSDHELNNLSWLKSEGQWNAKAVYPTAYDKLLKVYNGIETVEGLSVKLSTETYTDYDFVLNTAGEKFRLPLQVKQKFYNAVSGNYPVVGNGMTLGLYGHNQDNVFVEACLRDVNHNIVPNSSGVGVSTDSYNSNLTTNGLVGTNFGVTKDPTKSGLVAKLSSTEVSGLYLYFYVGETVQNANLIDAGRIGEQLANKQDKCIHIIDTYVNGTSGYRIWSDGYCEQWGGPVGASTITLAKKFKDTNYNILLTTSSADNPSTFRVRHNNKSINTFTIIMSGNPAGCYWKTSGYLAKGEY